MSRLLLLFLLLLTACTDRDSPAPDAEPDPVAEDLLQPLTLNELAAVCDGQGQARTAAFDRSRTDELPRLLVLARDSVGASYREEGSEVYFPEERLIENSADYPETEVVVCMTGVRVALAESCEFSITSEPGKTFYLDMYDAFYDVRVRAARSGEELARFGLDAPFSTCPMFHSFSRGTERDHALVDPPLQELKDRLIREVVPDYDVRREYMSDADIRELDSLRAIADSLRRAAGRQ